MIILIIIIFLIRKQQKLTWVKFNLGFSLKFLNTSPIKLIICSPISDNINFKKGVEAP